MKSKNYLDSRLEFIINTFKNTTPNTRCILAGYACLGTGTGLWLTYEAGGKTALEIGIGTIAIGSAYLAYRIARLKSKSKD